MGQGEKNIKKYGQEVSRMDLDKKYKETAANGHCLLKCYLSLDLCKFSVISQDILLTHLTQLLTLDGGNLYLVTLLQLGTA